MFTRLAQNLPIQRVLEELAAHPTIWDVFTLRQTLEGSPHHDTRCVVLRGPAIPDTYSAFNDLQAYDYPIVNALPSTANLISYIVKEYLDIQLGRVMLVELAPGGHIDTHKDEGLYAEHYDTRFHLVLTSDAGNVFRNEIAQVWMQPGELWHFEHQREHEVWNNSATPRVHIIIDGKKN